MNVYTTYFESPDNVFNVNSQIYVHTRSYREPPGEEAIYTSILFLYIQSIGYPTILFIGFVIKR